MEIPIELQKIVDPNKECCCVYHFSIKCKEWAYNDKSLCGYSIELKSYKSEFGYWLCELMSEDITFSGDTEPEAIFKACEYILNSINQ